MSTNAAPSDELTLEEVVRESSRPVVDEYAEGQELHRCVRVALAGMPGAWRRTLLLHHVNGLSREELARAAGTPLRQIDRILEHARACLRDHLLESGYAFDERKSHRAA